MIMNATGGWSHPVIACVWSLRSAIKGRFFLRSLRHQSHQRSTRGRIHSCQAHPLPPWPMWHESDCENQNVDRFGGFVGYIHWIDEEKVEIRRKKMKKKKRATHRPASRMTPSKHLKTIRSRMSATSYHPT